MSLLHLAQQLSVKRDVPPIGFIDDDLSIITYQNTKRTIESQQNIEITDHYKKIIARRQKRAQENRNYYYRNAKEIAEKARFAYHSSPARKEQKRITSKKWRENNREKAREISRKWMRENRDKRNAALRLHFEKLKAKLTPEELKAFYREKNQKAIASRKARLGIEEYRRQERERLNNWYKNLPPDVLEMKRAQSRERSRLRREKIKQSPELLAIYREKQAENQRKQRAKRKLQKEQHDF